MPFVDDMDLNPKQEAKSKRFVGHDEDTLNLFGEIDEDQPIWRYMSYVQLLNIFETKSLHFTRADYFEDDFEGTVPEEKDLPDEFFESKEDDFFETLKESVFISCWHINEHEHWGMWQNYSEKGMAIKTTVGDLREALQADSQNMGIHFSNVEYLDYRDEEIGLEVAYDSESVANLVGEEEIEDFWDMDEIQYSLMSPLIPFGYKRKYFGYENEFRAITMPPTIDPLYSDYESLNCDIDLTDLIDEIVISPLVDEWKSETMMGVLLNRYELEDLVLRTSYIQ